MRYRKMYVCENSLEIYGEWENLKKFFIDNRSENILSFAKMEPIENGEDCFEKWGTEEDADIQEYEENIMDENLDQLFYIFLTRENPPIKWLEKIAKKYNNLEFNLIYQNRDKDLSGEIIYKKGRLYHHGIHNFGEEEAL